MGVESAASVPAHSAINVILSHASKAAHFVGKFFRWEVEQVFSRLFRRTDPLGNLEVISASKVEANAKPASERNVVLFPHSPDQRKNGKDSLEAIEAMREAKRIQEGQVSKSPLATAYIGGDVAVPAEFDPEYHIEPSAEDLIKIKAAPKNYEESRAFFQNAGFKLRDGQAAKAEKKAEKKAAEAARHDVSHSSVIPAESNDEPQVASSAYEGKLAEAKNGENTAAVHSRRMGGRFLAVTEEEMLRELSKKKDGSGANAGGSHSTAEPEAILASKKFLENKTMTKAASPRNVGRYLKIEADKVNGGSGASDTFVKVKRLSQTAS